MALSGGNTPVNLYKISADGGHMGTLIEMTQNNFKIAIEIIKRSDLNKFKVLPKRWIVEERLHGWIPTEVIPNFMNGWMIQV